MKKTVLLLFSLFVLSSFLSATDYVSNGSGNWTTTTIWTPNGTPGTGDNVTIISTHSVTLNTSITLNDLTVSLEAELTGTGSVSFVQASNVLINGYFELQNVTCPTNKSIASFVVNGNLKSNGTLNYGKTSITGDGGVVYASVYSGNPAWGSVMGESNPVNGQIYGSTGSWTGNTSSDWNNANNWGGGVIPSNTTDVTINNVSNLPVITTTANNAKSVVIQSGSLTIAPNADLTVAEGITSYVGSGGLVIQSAASGSGSLIYASGIPAATVQRYVPSNANHLVAPMTDASTANDFYVSSLYDTWLSYHSESGTPWTYITDLSTVLNRGQGYSYWVEGTTPSNTVEFTGALTASDQSPVLSYSGDEANQGWNLLGNPFSSALDWDQGSWGTNIEGTVYVWDINYNTTGDYRSWNGGVGSLTGGIIPMGQGFFVKSSSAGAFTIPVDARVHDTQAFYKSTNDNEPTQYVRIQLDGEGFGNTLFVGFPENGTDDFDYRGDATKLYSSTETPQLFAVENGKELCINANAPLTEAGKTVAMNLVQVVDGDYTLTISDLDQLPDAIIMLEDQQTGATQDLNENPVYSFSASSNDAAERFLLHFAYSPTGIGDDIEQAANMNIYANGKDIYIRSMNDAINQQGKVYVYDLMGRELVQKQISHGDLMKLTVNLNNAYAVVKVVKEGSIKTEKVFIK